MISPDPRNWCYINYLEVDDIIIIPALNVEEDIQALKQIQEFNPRKRVYQIEASEIVNEGGALNCITWNCMNCSADLSVNKIRFNKLMRRFKTEADDSFANLKKVKFGFSEPEIKLLAKVNIGSFAKKYPIIAEYYMSMLSE